MNLHSDWPTLAEGIGQLMLRRHPMRRLITRRTIFDSYKPMPNIWGQTYESYLLWFNMGFFASLIIALVIIVAGMVVSEHQRWYNQWANYVFLTMMLILIGMPVWVVVYRRIRIILSRQSNPDEFMAGIAAVAPDIDHDFALAAREAIAAGYCVPANIISPTATRAQMKALCLWSSPLVIEIIAEIYGGVHVAEDRLLALAREFRGVRPANVAELVKLLYEKTASLR